MRYLCILYMRIIFITANNIYTMCLCHISDELWCLTCLFVCSCYIMNIYIMIKGVNIIILLILFYITTCIHQIIVHKYIGQSINHFVSMPLIYHFTYTRIHNNIYNLRILIHIHSYTFVYSHYRSKKQTI